MKRNWKTALALASIAVLTISSVAGCSADSSTNSTDNVSVSALEASDTAAAATDTPASGLKGSISMVGSTSMEKFSTALSEVFMEIYPDITILPEFVGSGAGVEAVNNGSADIGNSSRELKEEEKAAGVVENIVAIDGIAVITDAANQAANLTKEQLTGIYNGTVTNWKDAGGADQPIVVIGREAGSGTRTAFEEILDLAGKCKYSNELDSTGAVMAKVSSTPGAIGYVSLDVLDDSVKTIKLDDTEATPENIKSGTYFLSRPFVMATKGEISEQNELVKALFNFINSPEGSELIESVGLITVD